MIFSMAASLSCRKERTYTAEVKDGVRYVHNLKPVSEKPVADLSFVRKIGELESKDPDFQFVRPMSVAEDGRGTSSSWTTRMAASRSSLPTGSSCSSSAGRARGRASSNTR